MSDPSIESTPSAILAIGGAPDGRFPLPPVAPGSLVVAADSGLDLLVAHGIVVDHVVGDLDSVDPRRLDEAIAAGTTAHRHLADKDATDLELALSVTVEIAAARGIAALHVVGTGGGRLDHLVGDLSILAGPIAADLDVTAHLDRATVTVVRPGSTRLVYGSVGDLVSLIPVHGPVAGVTTEGLRWPLLDADLSPGTSRGVSNQLLGDVASVTVAAGVLLALQPGCAAPPVAPRTASYDPSPRTPRGTP